MMQINLVIPVKTNEEVTPEEIANIVGRLLDVGLTDAVSTIEACGEDGNGDIDAARLAVSLDIGPPAVLSKPRVLVVVGGGVADPINDKGVDVEVFDWDNYRAGDRCGVSAKFADIANQVGVPVEH